MNNPVLFNRELYYLDRRGQLGVFNPNKMTWWVITKPEPIYYEVSLHGHACCALLELHGDLIAVFKADNTDIVRIFKLDQSKMVWSKLENLRIPYFLSTLEILSLPFLHLEAAGMGYTCQNLMAATIGREYSTQWTITCIIQSNMMWKNQLLMFGLSLT